MSDGFRRRDFLKASAVIAGAAAGGFTCVEIARAAAIEAPEIDKLAMRVLIDSSHDLFFRPSEVNGVSVQPAPRTKDYRRSCTISGDCRCSSRRREPASSAR